MEGAVNKRAQLTRPGKVAALQLIVRRDGAEREVEGPN
jgi:hypothetical protein